MQTVTDARVPEVFNALGSMQLKQAYCEKSCFHFQQDDRDRLADVFSWETLNKLLSLDLLDEKRMRVVKDGRDLPTAFYRRDNERKSIDARKLTALLNQGASLAINSVQYFSPDVRRIAGQIERWLDQKVNVNGYVSFGTGGAFTSHFDTHDVLVLQIHGDKVWTIYDEPEPYPILEHVTSPRHGGRGRPVLMEANLRSGDMLFVPRGYFHQAAVQNSTSVHLTFGIRSARGMDYLDELRKRCLQSEVFRKDIHTAAGPQAAAEHEAAMKAALHAMVDEFSFDAFLEKRRHKREPLDFFQLGPAQELAEDPLLVPLVRQRTGYAMPPKSDAEVVTQVMGQLVDHNSMRLTQLCESLDGTVTPAAVRATIDLLVRERLVQAS